MNKIKDLLIKFRETLNTPASLTRICLILSAYTLFAFHIPFFGEVFDRISGNLNGAWIVISMFIIMLTLNFFVYYILLYLGRIVGKGIIAFTMIANASCFFSWGILLCILLLGVIPSIWLFKRKMEYGSVKRFFANIGVSLLVIIAVLLGNRNNILWIDYNATVLGSKLMPWSYTINSIRYYNYWICHSRF